MASTQSTACYNNPVSFTFLVCMVIFAVLLAAGGVSYAVFKHEQVTLRTEIDSIRRATNEKKMVANQFRAKANAMAGREEMFERLRVDGSLLQDIESSQTEVVVRVSRLATVSR